MRSKLRILPYLLLLLPLDLVAGLLLCLSVPLWRRQHRETETRGPDLSKTTIIILNWDGKHLLEESLPPVIEAARRCEGNHEILVVDNGSTDGSVDFVRRSFPSVRVLALDRNYGFIGGNNRGVAAAGTEIVVLLNNDMIVDETFLKPLLDGFTDSSVFGVASQVFFADPLRRREETGKTRARFNDGFFYLWHDDICGDDEARGTIPVLWVGGGACAIDRRKWLAIGGFDPLYRPLYVEDVDLSYQAWKRGWKCMLAPASRVVHKHRSTSSAKLGEDFVENTIRKNQYLFLWKNVTDLSMVLDHLLSLPAVHARAMLRRTASFEMRAFMRAFRQLPEALRKRFTTGSQQVVSDREVLKRSGG